MKRFKFMIPAVVMLVVIVFLTLTYKAPEISIEDSTSNKEVVSSTEEQTTSFYIEETETATTAWALDDIEIETSDMNGISDDERVVEEEVNGTVFYKPDVSWTKGYLTSEEFWTMCITAGKLYGDTVNTDYTVSVRLPSEAEMSIYDKDYLYTITWDYKLILRVYITLKSEDSVVEEGVHELTVVYDVDHIVLESGD